KPAVALAPVTLTYRRRIATPRFPGLDVDVDWVLFNGTARGALRVHLVDGPDRLGAMLQYPTGSVAGQRLAQHWRTLLGAAVARPDTRIGELAILPPDERRLVLENWNATA